MDSAFIHQAANELVQNVGTRNIKQLARSCSLDISETSRIKDNLQDFFKYSIIHHIMQTNQIEVIYLLLSKLLHYHFLLAYYYQSSRTFVL